MGTTPEQSPPCSLSRCLGRGELCCQSPALAALPGPRLGVQPGAGASALRPPGPEAALPRCRSLSAPLPAEQPPISSPRRRQRSPALAVPPRLPPLPRGTGRGDQSQGRSGSPRLAPAPGRPRVSLSAAPRRARPLRLTRASSGPHRPAHTDPALQTQPQQEPLGGALTRPARLAARGLAPLAPNANGILHSQRLAAPPRSGHERPAQGQPPGRGGAGSGRVCASGAVVPDAKQCRGRAGPGRVPGYRERRRWEGGGLGAPGRAPGAAVAAPAAGLQLASWRGPGRASERSGRRRRG